MVNKSHPCALDLADRHYTRQKPGTPQFTRPGVNLVMVTEDGKGVWCTWRPIPQIGRMDRLEAWECTMFRNEGHGLSSDMIRAAVDLTWRKWGWPPRDGLITAIGIQQTSGRRGKRNAPGHCFEMAGWTRFEHPSGAKDKVWLRAPHPERLTKSEEG